VIGGGSGRWLAAASALCSDGGPGGGLGARRRVKVVGPVGDGHQMSAALVGARGSGGAAWWGPAVTRSRGADVGWVGVWSSQC
jgi:hypothetical protein